MRHATFRARAKQLGCTGRGTKILGLGLVIVSLFADPALASNYGYVTGYPIRYPDSADHWYCFLSVPQLVDRDRMVNAANVLDNQTDMYDVASSGCSSSTDVEFGVSGWCNLPNFPGSGCPLGYTRCEQHVYWGICDRFSVWIDPTTHYLIALQGPDIGLNYNMNMNMSVCHELGHSAGLWHLPPGSIDASYGCMNSEWITFQPGNTWQAIIFGTYGSHDIGHINARF